MISANVSAFSIGKAVGRGGGVIPAGQIEYTTPGTFSFVAPEGVTEVSVVAVGGGGGGLYYNLSGAFTYSMNGGSGGGLGWKNNISVIPGNAYTVVVGVPGYRGTYPTAFDGGQSYFISPATVSGGGGIRGQYAANAIGGTFVGTGGGNGGAIDTEPSNGSGPAGGGGAGGYSGNGGGSSPVATNPGSGGSGAAGYVGANDWSGGGGGVGILGEGASGASSGAGGSGGGNGTSATPGTGGLYGGGGGGSSRSDAGIAGNGGGGAVRIIWGEGRAFPSTNTGNV